VAFEDLEDFNAVILCRNSSETGRTKMSLGEDCAMVMRNVLEAK